ncbi:MAG: hypothetical protein PHD49_02575 [Candidatus Shapirobacteria bacterium]|nr:hypothetical protein [Candidatus Shapirobacteria bacterium]
MEIIIGIVFFVLMLVFFIFFGSPILHFSSQMTGSSALVFITNIRLIIFLIVISEVVVLIYRWRNKILLKKHLFVISLSLLISYIGTVVVGVLGYMFFLSGQNMSSEGGAGAGFALAFMVASAIFLIGNISAGLVFFSIYTWFFNKLTKFSTKSVIVKIIIISIIFFVLSLLTTYVNKIFNLNTNTIFNVTSEINLGNDMTFATDNKIYFIDKTENYKNNGLKEYDVSTKKIKEIDKKAISIKNHDNNYLYYNVPEAGTGHSTVVKRLALTKNSTDSTLTVCKIDKTNPQCNDNTLMSIQFNNQGLAINSQGETIDYNGTNLGYSYMDGNYYYLSNGKTIDNNKHMSILEYYDSISNKNYEIGNMEDCENINDLCKYINYKNFLIFANTYGLTIIDLDKKEITKKTLANVNGVIKFDDDSITTEFNDIYDIRNDNNIAYFLSHDDVYPNGSLKIIKYNIITDEAYLSDEKYKKAIISDKNIYYDGLINIKSKKLADLTYKKIGVLK